MREPDQALIIITNPALLHVTHIFSLTEMCGNIGEEFTNGHLHIIFDSFQNPGLFLTVHLLYCGHEGAERM